MFFIPTIYEGMSRSSISNGWIQRLDLP